MTAKINLRILSAMAWNRPIPNIRPNYELLHRINHE